MNRLKELRVARKMNMRELAAHLNMPYTTYVNYEKGAREPNSETLIMLANFFGVSVDYLLGRSDEPFDPMLSEQISGIDSDILDKAKGNLLYAKQLQSKRNRLFSSNPAPTEDFVTFPVYGDIAAGYDSIGVEDWSGEVIDIPTSYLKGRSKEEFIVLRVKGSSMFPTYQDGDKVLVLKQTTLNYSGQVGAILYDGEYATLKKVEYTDGEEWMRLVPINPNVESELIEGERLTRCRIIGIPKLLIRDITH